MGTLGGKGLKDRCQAATVNYSQVAGSQLSLKYVLPVNNLKGY